VSLARGPAGAEAGVPIGTEYLAVSELGANSARIAFIAESTTVSYTFLRAVQ
jgi:hypothetical protein